MAYLYRQPKSRKRNSDEAKLEPISWPDMGVGLSDDSTNGSLCASPMSSNSGSASSSYAMSLLTGMMMESTNLPKVPTFLEGPPSMKKPFVGIGGNPLDKLLKVLNDAEGLLTIDESPDAPGDWWIKTPISPKPKEGDEVMSQAEGKDKSKKLLLEDALRTPEQMSVRFNLGFETPRVGLMRANNETIRQMAGGAGMGYYYRALQAHFEWCAYIRPKLFPEASAIETEQWSAQVVRKALGCMWATKAYYTRRDCGIRYMGSPDSLYPLESMTSPPTVHVGIHLARVMRSMALTREEYLLLKLRYFFTPVDIASADIEAMENCCSHVRKMLREQCAKDENDAQRLDDLATIPPKIEGVAKWEASLLQASRVAQEYTLLQQLVQTFD